MCYYGSMKKFFLLILISFIALPSFGMNFGMYKPEEDYGLIDGFKFNFSKRDRAEAGDKLIQLKQEVPGEKERMQREKERYEANKDRKEDEEYQMFRFMLEDTVAF